MSTEPSLLGLLASGVLVAAAVAISLWRRLGVERSLVWSALRALGQLLLVGVALQLVLDESRPLVWSWVWVVLMVFFAGWTTSRRVGDRSVFGLAVAAFATSCVVSLGVLFGLSVFPLQARTLVPLAGMVIGNSLAATVLAARAVERELDSHAEEVEARLALGASSTDAARPYLRAAARTALVPQIETTKAVGLVFLPGAMVGLILAGADASAAVKVQVAVMYLVLGSVATTTTVVTIGVGRRRFSRDHRLIPRGARERP